MGKIYIAKTFTAAPMTSPIIFLSIGHVTAVKKGLVISPGIIKIIDTIQKSKR